MKKVAVIMSVYKNDRAEYVRQSFDSILSQRNAELRLFVGVDGAVDSSLLQVLGEYALFENVKMNYYPTNRGLAAVLNDLLEQAFAEGFDFFARMDADDIALPERIEKQVLFLQQNQDVDMVGGAIEEIDEKGNKLGKIVQYPLSPEACFSYFAKRDPVAHPAVLFRRSYFEKAGCLYRSEFRKNQDTMLWYDGLKNGCRIANISDVVLQFRVTDDFFAQRRNGYAFAKGLLKARREINRGLNYGPVASIYAYLLFVLRISPVWLKRIAYKLL